MIEGITFNMILTKVVITVIFLGLIYGGIWWYYKIKSKKTKNIEEKVEEQLEPDTQSTSIINPKRHFCNKQCNICGSVIGQNKYTKQGGYYMHKSCFKQQKKMTGL